MVRDQALLPVFIPYAINQSHSSPKLAYVKPIQQRLTSGTGVVCSQIVKTPDQSYEVGSE